MRIRMHQQRNQRLWITFTTVLFIFASGCLAFADDSEEIVDLPDSSNLNDTFYLVDVRSNGGSNNNSSNNSSTSLELSGNATNNSETTEIPVVDDFWDPPSPVTVAPPGDSTTTANIENNESVSVVTFRVTVTSTPAPPTTTPPTPPPFTIISTGSTPSTVSTTRRPTASSTTSVPSSTIASLRLSSNTVTVKPDFRFVPSASTVSTVTTTATASPSTTSTTTKKPKKNKNKVNLSFNSVERIPVPEEGEGDTEDNTIWKLVLHGTNMNSEELRMCNKTLLAVHFKPYSRRKVAKKLKKELDQLFSQYHYRFSVIVQTTSRNSMGKALHGVWLSMSLNGVHYFITATYRLVEGPKLKEEDLSRIEYWATIHAIGAHNMTGFRRYNRIAAKLKFDLDRQYGNGNVWSVVIVKNRYLVKAKALEDNDSRVEFSRLNGGHFIVWRGGQNIDDSSRNARYMSSGAEKDDEDTSEHSFREYNGGGGGRGSRARGRRSDRGGGQSQRIS